MKRRLGCSFKDARDNCWLLSSSQASLRTGIAYVRTMIPPPPTMNKIGGSTTDGNSIMDNTLVNYCHKRNPSNSYSERTQPPTSPPIYPYFHDRQVVQRMRTRREKRAHIFHSFFWTKAPNLSRCNTVLHDVCSVCNFPLFSWKRAILALRHR